MKERIFSLPTFAGMALPATRRWRGARIWSFMHGALIASLCSTLLCAVTSRAGAVARPVLTTHVQALLRPARGPTFGSGAIVERADGPIFSVDGKPFFVYGAAFFYERLPRATWRTSMYELKYGLGINTLDLYVPWNWHELHDGDFDFTGRTNPRRDLREVLRLARTFGFRLIVRPGPVIRNEWRNGGYPAWLLQRPEYHMPLRDRLEGRYPPTATLQNAHSDAAAAQWLHNATHLRYARRWLQTVLRQFRPDAGSVIAIALDDDQGAYIDNQTWPAPHLRAYLEWLRGVVRASVGPRVPTFINTYQMKVTASSPVWAMGNWYQSAAYSLGEHDRTQLEFSTGLLQTRPHQPLMASEFQAGWLQQPEDILPQPAAPSNTLLAMDTMIGMGVRGIVNFPAQDTLYPAGWEVPFANAFYAWDAALGYNAATHAPTESTLAPRGVPTRTVGCIVATFGPMLAAAHVVPDAAIAYLTSAYDAANLTNADIAAIAEQTMAAQRSCRRLSLTCELVDLRYAGRPALRRFPLMIVPSPKRGPLHARPFVVSARTTLTFYRSLPGKTVIENAEPTRTDVEAALQHARVRRAVAGAPGGSFAVDEHTGAGFLTLLNYAGSPRYYKRLIVHPTGESAIRLPPTIVRPHSAAILPVNVPLRSFNSEFGASDRFSSSCAVIGVAKKNGGGVTFALDPTATQRCGLIARVGVRSYGLTMPTGTKRVSLPVNGPPHLLPAPLIEARAARKRHPWLSLASFQSRAPGAHAVRTSPLHRHAVLAQRSVGDFASGGVEQRTLPLRNGLLIEEPRVQPVISPTTSRAYREDVYRDGEGAVVLENDLVRVVIAPQAGGRAFVFEDKRTRTNAFSTVGALRDDVLIEPSLSRSDRIAKYTAQMSAGTFNRPYGTMILRSGPLAQVGFWYDAPDAYPHGAHYARVVTLAPHARCLAITLTSRFGGDDVIARRQRAVTVSSLTVGDPRLPDARLLPSALPLRTFAARSLGTDRFTGLFGAPSHALVLETWSPSQQPSREIGRTNSVIVRVPEAPDGATHVAFAFEPVATYAQALRRAEVFAAKPGRCTPGR